MRTCCRPVGLQGWLLVPAQRSSRQVDFGWWEPERKRRRMLTHLSGPGLSRHNWSQMQGQTAVQAVIAAGGHVPAQPRPQPQMSLPPYTPMDHSLARPPRVSSQLSSQESGSHESPALQGSATRVSALIRLAPLLSQWDASPQAFLPLAQSPHARVLPARLSRGFKPRTLDFDGGCLF